MGCTFFLEKQILNEIFNILFGSGERLRASESGDSDLPKVEKALRFVEGNLFQPIDLDDICSFAKAPKTTLIRQFKKELGETPIGYLQRRRLEEALVLLKNGHYNVGDVAILIGYNDLTAFSSGL